MKFRHDPNLIVSSWSVSLQRSVISIKSWLFTELWTSYGIRRLYLIALEAELSLLSRKNVISSGSHEFADNHYLQPITYEVSIISRLYLFLAVTQARHTELQVMACLHLFLEEWSVTYLLISCRQIVIESYSVTVVRRFIKIGLAE